MAVASAELNIVEWHIALNQNPTAALRIGPKNNNASGAPQIVCNDKLKVRLFFYQDEDSLLVPRRFPDGVVVGMNAVQRTPIGSDDLFIVGDFTLVEDGDVAYYEGRVNAATGRMLALLTTETADVLVNVQVSNAAGGLATDRKTVAYFTATALKDAFNDGGATADPVAEYMGTNGVINGGNAAGDVTSFSSAGSTSSTGSSSSSSSNTSASTSASGSATFTTTVATNTYSTTFPS